MTRNTFSLGRIKEAWNYRSEPENMRFLGGAFWRVLLALVVLAFLGALTLGAQELSAAENTQSAVQAPVAKTPPLDPQKLQNALAQFSSREAGYEQLSQSSAAGVADPSK